MIMLIGTIALAMSLEGPRFRPGMQVRVARQSADRAKLAVFGFPLHEHFGDVGRVVDIDDGPIVRYEVRFDDHGEERLVFAEDELEPV